MKPQTENRIAKTENRTATGQQAHKPRPQFQGRMNADARFPEAVRQIASSPQFRPSEPEREPLFCDLQDDLETFVRASAFSLNHPGKEFYDAGDVLENALSLFTAECIAEALSLHGITDRATVAETCRCVLKGGTMFDGAGFTQGSNGEDPEADLTGLTSEQVNALPPEKRQAWQIQSQRDQEEFHSMMELVNDLYPHCRAYFKAERRFQLGDMESNADTPLYRAFDILLEFAEDTLKEPAFVTRFRRQHRRNVAIAHRIEARRDKKAAHAPKEAAHADA